MIKTGRAIGKVWRMWVALSLILSTLLFWVEPVPVRADRRVRITEIMPNPAAVDDARGEWFELHNEYLEDKELEGWQIEIGDSITHTITISLSMAPDEYLVIGNNPDFATNGGVHVDYTFDFSLDNQADKIILSSQTSFESDAVYDSSSPIVEGASLELNGDWMPATVVYGCYDRGTPGGLNGVDSFPPRVCETIPENGAADVDTSVIIKAFFNEDMDETTITADVFTLTPSVPGTLSYDATAQALTFEPDVSLAQTTTYTATISGAVTDVLTNPMGTATSWSFTTGVPLQVVSTIPYDGQIDVSVTTNVGAAFNRAIVTDTLAFTLTDPDNYEIGGDFEYTLTSFTFIPDNDSLEYETAYTATVAAGLQDTTGHTMAEDYSWSFTTEPGRPPQVVFTYPPAGEREVDVNASVGASFDKDINTSTLSFTLTGPDGPVSGDIGYDSPASFAFAPASPLEYETTYSATIAAGLEDMAGNATTDDYSWDFTTEPSGPLQVVSTIPYDGQTDVSVTTNVSATFDQPIIADTLAFTLTGPDGPVSGSISYDSPTSFTFVSGDVLEYETTYTATIAGSVTDLAGNPMGNDFVWNFTTTSNYPPVAAFTVSDDHPAVNETVIFTNTSTGTEPLAYQWNLGDGSPIVTDTHPPPHSYTDAGVYTVVLTATNPWGVDIATAMVHVGHSSMAAFTVSDEYPSVGELVTFINNSTGGDPLTYEWDFGDGETSQQSTPTHVYDAPGDYTITLTVTNPWGESTATALVHVGTSPEASFTISNDRPAMWETIFLTNTSTGSEPLSCEWDFGDGSPTSTECDPSHVYVYTLGDYVITLTVSNPWGQDTATTAIIVSGWRNICVPQRIEITGIGMGDRYAAINPQTLSLADPAGVNWLLAQVAGCSSAPESATFTTDAPQSVTLNEPSRLSLHGYTFEVNLQPTGHITGSVSNPQGGYPQQQGVPPESNYTPRGLILYARREMVDEWTSVGKTTNHFVWPDSGDTVHTEILTFPPLAVTTDLFITAVVIDNDDDAHPMVLEAAAGDVAGSVTELGPTDGDGLNVVYLTLQQVLTGTSQVSVTLRSPDDVVSGDSLVLVGLNVSYPCLPAPILQGVVDMQGRPAKPAPSWAIPLTVWLTPAGSSSPVYTFTPTTDQNGEFRLYLEGITPGLYDVRVKGDHTLSNLAPNVSLVPGENHYFFGTLLEGDAETVATFDQVLLADANVLPPSFNKCYGDPGFVANADLDENGCVLLSDLGLLAGNFNKEGGIVVKATSPPLLASPQIASQTGAGNARIVFSTAEVMTAVDKVVTLRLDIDPRGEPVNGGMIHLSFDPTLVEIVDVTLTDHLPLVLDEPSVNNQQGVVRFGAVVLGQTITTRFSIATLSLKVKAATSGTHIAFADDFPATNISGPWGGISSETRGVTLRTQVQEYKRIIYLSLITK